MNLLGVLEGLLFVVGDEGLTITQVCHILKVEEVEAKELLKKLNNSYESEERGLRISYLGDAFKLITKKEHKEYYRDLISNPENNLLSQAALETLAIIAYNQPITRVEIDEMRGVSNSYLIRKLVNKGLIKEAGKSSMPGHPYLYTTTKEFLDFFGIATINDLPEITDSLINQDVDVDLFTSNYKEES